MRRLRYRKRRLLNQRICRLNGRGEQYNQLVGHSCRANASVCIRVERDIELPRYFSHQDSVFAETSFSRRDNAIRDAIRPLMNASLSQRIRYRNISGEIAMHRDTDLRN